MILVYIDAFDIYLKLQSICNQIKVSYCVAAS